MNNYLDLLRQHYCQPATFTRRATNHLFPLEKDCDEGKAFAAKAPPIPLDLQEFDPAGLEQTYRDEATGAELPVYVFFDLERKHKLTFEITIDSIPAAADSSSLLAHMPFKKTQTFVRKLNERRIKAQPVVTISAIIAGLLPLLGCLLFHIRVMADTGGPYILLGATVFGAVLAYIASVCVLEQVCPWRKLVIDAEFNGILPREVRQKARAAKDHFHNLYLVVDQQHHWKSALLPDPKPRALDPLLIGELKHGRQHKFFLLHQFTLSAAEQYLADEFATDASSQI
jgi:hypothetical protein